ncbi:MAG: hypothetical protein CR217_15180 [Beijerinckiaceae bacterium]|nr:MAG: hypothetical protein CR217_15180 [Beijerinckiaceae bacterium]
MSLLASLSIRKKITAIFHDGSSKQNLGIPSVLELLDGIQDCPVEVDGNAPDASQILRDLSSQSGRKITAAPDGLVLTLPVTEPVVEPSEVKPPIPRTRRGDVSASQEPKFERKYKTLSSIFFCGSTKGQINSIYKTRITNPAKVEDFKAALAAGDVHLGVKPLTKSLLAKLAELGIDHEGE